MLFQADFSDIFEILYFTAFFKDNLVERVTQCTETLFLPTLRKSVRAGKDIIIIALEKRYE